MRRSARVVFATLVQLAVGPIAAYVLLFARNEDANDFVMGLMFPSMVAATALALSAAIAGGYGLWERRLWGWWLALLTQLLSFGAVARSLIESELTVRGTSKEWDSLAVAGTCLGSVILLLSPKVVRFYWRRHPQAQESIYTLWEAVNTVSEDSNDADKKPLGE